MNNKLHCISLGYLMLPLIIFFIGFIRLWYALPLIAISLYSLYRVQRAEVNSRLKLNKKHLAIILVLSIMASWLAGIGGFFCQTWDFLVKNPLLRDLCNNSWPLYIDLSKEPLEIQDIIGSDKVAFVYYLFFYLPAAACGKIGGELVARIVFMLWSALGIFLVLVNTIEFVLRNRVSSWKNVILALVVFFCFGGLDVIGYLPHADFSSAKSVFSFLITTGVGTWCLPYFSWSGNIAGIAWCFNQFIPLWLITIMILSKTNLKSIFFVYSFTLLYSPWAAIGLFPIVVYVWLRGNKGNRFLSKEEFMESLSIHNIIFPLVLLVVIGSYYGANSASSTGVKGWVFDFITVREFCIFYPLFLLIQIGVYVWFLRNRIKTSPILQVSILVLLALPFYKITQANDLLMRASIPALYVICVYWTMYVIDNFHKQKKLLVLILFLTSFSATHTYNWAFRNLVVYKKILIEDPIVSFYAIESSEYAHLCDFQFFAHNYQESFFFKYLAK